MSLVTKLESKGSAFCLKISIIIAGKYVPISVYVITFTIRIPRNYFRSGLFYSIISSHQFFELFLSQIFYVLLFMSMSLIRLCKAWL